MQKTIADVLRETPGLEAELLLMHVLGVNRATLFAHPEFFLTSKQLDDYTKKTTDLLRGVPLNYLVGEKEFWSLNFIVTPDVLIPRPETELLVELILEHERTERFCLADLGTGSGAIAIALQSEKPHWEIHATDQSEKALEIARQNAARHHCQSIHFHQGNWCNALPQQNYFDVIVSNPPYIAKNDPHLDALQYEPMTALVSAENGLQDLREIIFGARHYLKQSGVLYLEHGYNQAEAVRALLQEAGYAAVCSFKDLSGMDRVSKGIYRS